MLIDRPPEAGPTGAAVVLPVGFEQGQVAAGTDVGAGSILVEQVAAAGELGLREAQYLVLLGSQTLTPYLVAQVEFFHCWRRISLQPGTTPDGASQRCSGDNCEKRASAQACNLNRMFYDLSCDLS